MQFINYFFASAVSFSGLIIGMLLIRIAPEEQKPLGKYFEIARKILLLLIFAFLAFYLYNDSLNFLVLLGYFAFAVLIEYSLHDLPRKTMVTYTLLGILFFLSSKNANLFVIESGLVLLYGIPTASLMHKKKEEKRIIFYNLGFMVVANLLFFL
ncbi:hypothetical protein HYX08_06170 [Candidatus Woesearchaeota archaeon]|nr:hypothetical protein [Candidatus Woesearchaeota archaeon]